MNKLNDGIFRLYHENDPFLSNLIRSIKRCVAIDKRFKQLKRFRKICLYTCEDNERLELLKGKYSGKYSIRINDQYRIIFRFENSNTYDVEIIDYH